MLQTSIAGALAVHSSAYAARPAPEARYTMDLVCGAVGIKADQRQAIELASKYGFQSVAPDSRFLARLDAREKAAIVESLQQHNLVWGAAGLPVDFRSDEQTFRKALQQFPKQAQALQQVGATRVGTWIKPFHPELTYVANFKQHARRLRECVKIMGDHGLRFGMEYVGTKKLWTSTRHAFIHTMAETKELIAEIGLPGVGFVLDSWHWYTAGETAADLLTLSNNDVVACDLNDAPRGIDVSEQIDNQRELPAATGVIDVAAFLKSLQKIGYDGPIRAEPFNAKLNALENDAAAAATAAAIRKAFALANS